MTISVLGHFIYILNKLLLYWWNLDIPLRLKIDMIVHSDIQAFIPLDPTAWARLWGCRPEHRGVSDLKKWRPPMNNGANSLVTRTSRPGKECEIEFRGGQIKSLVRKSCRVALSYGSDLSNDDSRNSLAATRSLFCFFFSDGRRHIIVSLDSFFFPTRSYWVISVKYSVGVGRYFVACVVCQLEWSAIEREGHKGKWA